MSRKLNLSNAFEALHVGQSIFEAGSSVMAHRLRTRIGRFQEKTKRQFTTNIIREHPDLYKSFCIGLRITRVK